MDSLFNLAVVLKVVDQMTGPLKNAIQAMEGLSKAAQAGQRMREAGQQMVVGGALVQGAAAQVNGALGSILRPAMDVQDALAKVGTVVTPLSGTVADAQARIRTAAVDWSKAHTDSAAKFVDTSYMMISAGLNEAAAIEATRTAMMVATATMGDSTDAANLVAIAYNNMGDKTRPVAEEIGRLGDVITATQQTFQFANLNQLTEGLKYGIPAALQYGLELEQLSAVIGQLNNAGLQGSMAGTAFAAGMKGMQKAAEDLGFEVSRTASGSFDFLATLRTIESQFGSLAEMAPETQAAFAKALGDEGWRGMSLLIGKSEELAANLGAVTDSAGAAAKATAGMNEGARAQYQILQNNIEAVRMTIGEHLLPLINQAIPRVQALVQGIGRFAEANPGLFRAMMILAGIAAAALTVVAPILMVGGAFMTMAGYGLTGIAKLGQGMIWLGTSGPAAAASMGKAVGAAGATVAALNQRMMAMLGIQRLIDAAQYRGGFFNLLRYEALRARYALMSSLAAMRAWVVETARAAAGAILALPARIWANVVAMRAWTVAKWQWVRANVFTMAGLRGLALSLGGALINGLRAAVLGFRALTVAMIANPVGLVVAAIAATAFLIYKYWGPISGFFRGLVGGIAEALKPLAPAFEGILGVARPVFTTVTALLSPVVSAVKALARWVGALLDPVEDVGGAAEDMGLRWGRAIGGVVASVMGVPARIAGVAADLVGAGASWVAGLARGVTSGGQAVVEAVASVGRSVISGFKGLLGIASPSKVFADFGRWIMDGLRDGLAQRVQAVIDTVKGVGSEVVARFKGLLGISSPSKVFAGFGSDLMAGLAVGINDNEKLAVSRGAAVARAVAGAAGAAVVSVPLAVAAADMPSGVTMPRVSDQVAAGTRGGGRAASGRSAAPLPAITINLSPTITVTGGGDGAAAEALVSRLREELTPDLVRAVEAAMEQARERADRRRYE